MDHIAQFKKSHTQVIVISAFIALMTLVGWVQQPGNLFVNIKTGIILIVLYFLLQGNRWAVNVTLILAGASVFQGGLHILKESSPATIIIYTIIIGSFVLIMWYLQSSKDFERFIRLKSNGYDSASAKPFNEIVKPEQLIAIDHKNIRTTNDYFGLAEKLVHASGLKNKNVALSKDEHYGVLTLETETVNYEIPFNREINVFDRQFIDRFNSILDYFGLTERFYIVHPHSILNIDHQSLTVAFVTEIEYQQLTSSGYLENKAG